MKRYLFGFVAVFFTFVSFANANEIIKKQIIENFGKIPLSFIINDGQYAPQVKFKTNSNGTTMFFTQEGTTFLLSRKVQKSFSERVMEAFESSIKNLISYKSYDVLKELDLKTDTEYYALKLRFVNANPNPEVAGEEQLAWNNNYFLGNDPDKWKTDVANYAKLRLKNLYEGVDLVYYGNNNTMKYDFVVQPGADPKHILLAYDFGDNPDEKGSLSINENGELIVATSFGNIIERKPYCYQIINGKKIECEANYQIIDENLNRFTLDVTKYNFNYSLIIDPELMFSTYFGGIGLEGSTGIKVDANGNIYIAGYTESNDFPTTSGAFDQSYNGVRDIFICKMNASGSALIYSTLIGGNNQDDAFNMALDSSGNVYFTGRTWSTNYPTTSGVFDGTFNGSDWNTIVTKVNALGNSLIYSTFLGGESYGNDLAIDSYGNAYITGQVPSSAGFPTTSGAYDQSHNGIYDIYVSKLNSSGSTLIYSTFIGGSLTEFGYNIALDSDNNAYITGFTNSTNFPVTSGSVDASYNGGSTDAFVCKLNSSGSALIYSTYIGGGGAEEGYDIALDANNNICITGPTTSSNFPVTSGAFDESQNGDTDAFVSKINSGASDF